MNLALVISELPAGGAQRVLTSLANHESARGRCVTLITLAAAGGEFYRLDPGIRRIGLGLMTDARHSVEGLRNNWRRWRRLRSALRAARPDLVVSFMVETNILVLLACAGLGLPVVVSERVDPRHYPIGPLRSLLRRALYPRAHSVVVQTEGVGRWMSVAIPGTDPRVIPNPALLPEGGGPLGAASERGGAGGQSPPAGGRVIAALGRLTRQKGFDILLRAFAGCASKHPEWSLVILGEGEERQALTRLAADLGVAARVHLPGVVPDPGSVLRRATLFVLSSRFEGFPNALLEAMACGLPVIAVDCPSGPGEIVRHGRNGLLVPPRDLEALTASMDRLMNDAAERRRLGEEAREVLERFRPTAVMALWDALIDEAARTRPARRRDTEGR
jgi:GalNAc-alpha-(1->4)-GalNAc-alpha-(1->3)-diNAcBac-PP-undecaprenol alpha-1,4-N-acetyl-D-galactosaminyltransferase